MSARRINPEWLAEQRYKIESLEDYTDVVKPTLTWVNSDNIVNQALVTLLDRLGVAYQIISIGVGVKKITTDTEICPKCHGTGRC